MPERGVSEAARGVAAMVAACTIWGLSPIYYRLLDHIPPLEVLAHRTIWSLVFFAGVLALQGRLGALGRALGSLGAVWVTALAALFISSNWFLFIYSVQIGRTTQTSLGYYMFPLVAVLIGRVVFKERLGHAQWLAVALAAAAVVVLTLGTGTAPWIALTLAATFGLYGLMKKRQPAGPVVSVTAEVLLLSPIAVAVIWAAHAGTGGAFGAGGQDTALLMLSGPITATPLILFSYAARRAALATVGLVQYLNPTLQFFCAVAIFGEPFGLWQGVAFPMIWTALAIYSWAALRVSRASPRPATSAEVPSAVLTSPRSEGSAKP